MRFTTLSLERSLSVCGDQNADATSEHQYLKPVDESQKMSGKIDVPNKRRRCVLSDDDSDGYGSEYERVVAEIAAIKKRKAQRKKLRDADSEALRHRVPAGHNGRSLVGVGCVVEHFWTEKLYRVLEVHDFWGGAWDMGGNDIDVEALDRYGNRVENNNETDEYWPRTTEDVHVVEFEALPLGEGAVATAHPQRPSNMGRGSFCECCCMYFDPEFVTWWWDDNAPPRFLSFDPHARPRQLFKHHSMCNRCRVHNRQGKVLWAWLANRVRMLALADYWMRVVHSPAYLPRLENEMRGEMGM